MVVHPWFSPQDRMAGQVRVPPPDNWTLVLRRSLWPLPTVAIGLTADSKLKKHK